MLVARAVVWSHDTVVGVGAMMRRGAFRAATVWCALLAALCACDAGSGTERDASTTTETSSGSSSTSGAGGTMGVGGGLTGSIATSGTTSGSGGTSGGAGGAPVTCGYKNMGQVLNVTPQIQLCLPATICKPETCPPGLGDCVNGKCIYRPGYKGLETLPEAWATQYCSLLGAAATSCHGVSQLEPAEVTAQKVAQMSGRQLCAQSSVGTCVGIVASSPMVVGNSETAIDPATSKPAYLWGLGMTEASGLCYEITGPGGTAVVAITDRCAGYCQCADSGFVECGACVNASDMHPKCPCVGTDPGLYTNCCGRTCGGVPSTCDWCAANNHPHFDLDDDTFLHICGSEAMLGSCKLSTTRFVSCLPPNPGWPANR